MEDVTWPLIASMCTDSRALEVVGVLDSGCGGPGAGQKYPPVRGLGGLGVGGSGMAVD